MTADCDACGTGPHSPPHSGRVARAGRWLGLASGAAAALLAPKCPLCLAAYLSLGIEAAGVISPVLRPLGIALAVFVLWRTFAGRAAVQRALSARSDSSPRCEARSGTPPGCADPR